jgi:hypothetical protein
VAIFTTDVDAENQTLINHKCVGGALNRHFCQTRVISSGSCHHMFISQNNVVVNPIDIPNVLNDLFQKAEFDF